MSKPTGRVVPTITEMFRYQAWMAMGKVANPSTGEIDRDLEAAKHMIDMLAELEGKTEGNLSEEEAQMLKGALTELRLNFVDESNRPADSEPGAPEADAAAEAGDEAAEAGDDAAQAGDAGEDK